jgi:methylase of polypeptide subunit release factors
MAVFKPNLTSRNLLKYSEQALKSEEQILDLGTGSGFIALELKSKYPNKLVYGSDLSSESIADATNKARESNLSIEFRIGSLFEPWQSMSFDFIINDVSGISNQLTSLGNWFTDIPCDSGPDGTDLTIDFLQNVKDYLTPNGLILTPLLSLSNVEKVEQFIQSNFSETTVLGEEFVPLPKLDEESFLLIKHLDANKVIKIFDVAGVTFFTTKFLAIRV